MRKLILLAAVIAIPAQTPLQQPKVYTYYLLPGQSAWNWLSVVIDPPLQLTLDSAGQAHLGMISTRKHAVAAKWSGSAWMLPDVPRAGSLECAINGLTASPGSDYSISGSALTLVLDFDPTVTTVLCSYDP